MNAYVVFKKLNKYLSREPKYRTFTLLRNRHKDFLEHVANYGKNEGSIGYQYIDNDVAELTIDHPSKRNSISGKMMNDLAVAVDDILYTKKPSTLIVRGIGKFFCSGADFSLSTDELNTPMKGAQMCSFMTDTLSSLRTSDIVSLCIINGPALGGGAELTTACDFRLMHSNTFIQFVHAKMGLTPGWGGVGRLMEICGRQNTLRILGTSVKMDANTAFGYLLVDEIQPSNMFDTYEKQTDKALAFLQPFRVGVSTTSVRKIKSLVGNYASQDAATNLKNESYAFEGLWVSEENKKAVASFLSQHKNKS